MSVYLAVQGKTKPKKGSSEMVYLLSRKLPPKAIDWIGGVQDTLKKYGWTAPALSEMYLIGIAGRLVGPNDTIHISHPTYSTNTSLTILGVSYKVYFTKGLDPIKIVEALPITDNATAMSLTPTKTGFVQVWAHRDSLFAKKQGLSGSPVSDGLNRGAMANTKDWRLLEEYIKTRRENHTKIARTAVCDIVKTITANLAAQEAELELATMRMNG